MTPQRTHGENAAAYWLVKASSPGWEKWFPTKEDATKELHNHICKSCLLGEMEYVDPSEDRGFGVEKSPPPDPHSAEDLLSTPCGCEFWLETDDGTRSHSERE